MTRKAASLVGWEKSLSISRPSKEEVPSEIGSFDCILIQLKGVFQGHPLLNVHREVFGEIAGEGYTEILNVNKK